MSFHRDLKDRDLHAPSNEQVENNSVASIPKLRTVKFNGFGTAFMQIELGNGANDVIRGITQDVIDNVANNNTGFITALGILTDVDTSSFAVNNFLYAGPNGVLQISVNGSVIAQVLVSDATQGKIYVQVPSSGTSVDEKVKASAADPTANFLDGKVDNSTIEVASNKLQVKPNIFSPTSHTHVENDITDLNHFDPNAVHDNVNGEISLIAEKLVPVNDDIILIEDSENVNVKKKVKLSNLPGGGGIASDSTVLQARRTTDVSITTLFTDINFDITDIENDPTEIEHDNINVDRFQLKTNGKYLVSYSMSTEHTATSLVSTQVTKNDTIVVPGSLLNVEDGNDQNENSRTFIVDATAGDFLTLQVKSNAGTATIKPDIVIAIVRLSGAKGETGAAGTGSTVNIQDEGTSLPNTPHSTINFTGTGVTATDSGAGVTTVNVPGGGSSTLGFAQAYGTSIQTLTSSVFTKLTASTTFLSSSDFDDNIGSSMSIRYIGASPAKVLVHYHARTASIDASKSAMNLKLTVNGTLQDATLVSGQSDTNSTPDTAGGSFILSLVTNDVVEMKANRNSGAQDLNVFEIVLNAVKLT